MKVFTWSDGFHAFTVAAASRPKALAAWGIARDIFKDGLAREIADGPDHDAALERPGEVIERGLTVDVGKAAPRRKKPPDKAARRKVETLEAELDALDRDQSRARSDLEAEARRVEAALADLDKAHARDRDRLVARLKTARARLG